MTNAMSVEIQLQSLFKKGVETVTEILEAHRTTLFLFDKDAGALWSTAAQGCETKAIRFPGTIGIAGRMFMRDETINIKNGYRDDRFNTASDKNWV
ncbi:MAG: GAF domain-containing protein [Myxococcota bacterium]|nr:GAF domain-containing protein [Myxococcota bacterium]